MKTTKILIVGLGGVGGFYGGLLAKHYELDPTVAIYFLARGENLKVIQDKGVEVQNKEEVLISKPRQASDDARDFGVVDYVFLCTKDYDLNATLHTLGDCIGDGTVLIPLLNGVSAYETLVKRFPKHEVWKGCTYIVSYLVSPGVVENISGRQRIVFGLDSGITNRMLEFEDLLRKAGIRVDASETATEEVWEKYILVSSSATATTYFNTDFGTVMTQHLGVVEGLLEEAVAIARAKGVGLELDIVPLIVERLKAIPGTSTTSMYRDFLAGKKTTELEIMTGFFVQQASELGIEAPYYISMYKDLLNKSL